MQWFRIVWSFSLSSFLFSRPLFPCLLKRKENNYDCTLTFIFKTEFTSFAIEVEFGRVPFSSSSICSLSSCKRRNWHPFQGFFLQHIYIAQGQVQGQGNLNLIKLFHLYLPLYVPLLSPVGHGDGWLWTLTAQWAHSANNFHSCNF